MTSQSRAPAHDIVVGIDAGGSATRARAVRDGVVIYEGAGGPGNPLAATARALRASYRAALAGCPAATHVGACVAGARGAAQRDQVAGLLAGHFPGATVRVVPDFVAALLAAPADTDVAVIAGTGSVVCSAAPGGGYAVSGGRGWVLGDHGSAARLGRAALEQYVADPAAAPAPLAAAVAAQFPGGSSDSNSNATGDSDNDGDSDGWREVVRAVHAAPDPARLLARAAPLLTAAAEDGAEWAARQLDAEMAALAVTTARHIAEHWPGDRPVRVALSGGVWASRAARSAFATALRRRVPGQVIVTRSADPIAGAVRLAESMRP